MSFASLNQRDLMVESFEFYFSQPKRSDGGVICVLLLSTKEIWWWSDLSFASLQQRDVIMEWFEFCFSQPKRSDGGVIWVLLLSTKEIWAWRWCDIKFLPFNLRDMLDRVISLVFSVYCTPREHPNNYKHIRDDLFIKDTAVLFV